MSKSVACISKDMIEKRDNIHFLVMVRILLGAPNKRLLDFEKPFCMSIISL